MANYRISETAKADLRRIYRRGVRQHGEAQADRYYDAFYGDTVEIMSIIGQQDLEDWL